MIIYLGLLIFSLLSLVISQIYPAYRKSISVFLTALLIFVAGFRYEVGTDYIAYKLMYDNIRMGLGIDTEWGFLQICKLCNAVGATSQMMFLITSVITISLLYLTYKKYSPNIIFSLLIFLCFGQMYLNTFNAVRQCIAIAFFGYSLQYINKSFIKYAITIGLATLFHSTAIILLPLYWIIGKRWNLILLVGTVLLITAFSDSISELIIDLVDETTYSDYLNFKNFAKEASTTNYLYLIISFGILLFSKKLMPGYSDRLIFINLNFIALLLFILFFVFEDTPMVMVITRLGYYFIFFYAITFTRIISDIKSASLKLLTSIGICAFLSFMYLRTAILLGDQYTLLPYQFNFNLF